MGERVAQRIRTNPDPFEPFCLSQGFRIGDMILLSGQAAIAKDGTVVGIGDFDTQADQVFRNIAALLALAGASLADVVKVTIYLTDMQHFSRVVALRRKWFTDPYPADSIVEVRALALPDLMIEIEATAIAKVRKIG
jgi:reactive intermediate/imine deaminase